MKQKDINAGRTCTRLGTLHAHSDAILKVPMVTIAARADPNLSKSRREEMISLTGKEESIEKRTQSRPLLGMGKL